MIHRTQEQHDRNLESLRREMVQPPARLANPNVSDAHFGRPIATVITPIAGASWGTGGPVFNELGNIVPVVLPSGTANVYVVAPEGGIAGEYKYRLTRSERIVNPLPFEISMAKNSHVFVERMHRGGVPWYIISGCQKLYCRGYGVADTSTSKYIFGVDFGGSDNFDGTSVASVPGTIGTDVTILSKATGLPYDLSFTVKGRVASGSELVISARRNGGAVLEQIWTAGQWASVSARRIILLNEGDVITVTFSGGTFVSGSSVCYLSIVPMLGMI